jgi:hypothetical protein
MSHPFAFNHHPQDAYWIETRLASLPFAYHDSIQREYANRYQTAGQHEGERRRNANLFLLDLSEQAGQTVFTLSDGDIRHKAERLALQCRKLSRLAADDHHGLQAVLGVYQSQGFDADHLQATYGRAGIVARLRDVDFWRRKLTRRQDRMQEHFAIQLGEVRRGRGLYVSHPTFDRIQARTLASINAMAAMEAVNEETGETVDMLQVLRGSVANPEVRRVELMVRMRGFENAATQAGHVGMFYTLTCPSKFHRFSGQDANPNYAGYSPREAQNYLTALWARIRSKFKRDGLTAYGFRVAEPHHDGCPHWHMLLFVQPAKHEAVTAIIRDYALLEDGDEPGAAEYRFKAKVIDASQGSATGYIVKYVSKNINGYAVDEDFEGGVDAADSAQRVRAWASLWGIRQFQQIGGAPVGVWRELRRLREALPAGLLEEARLAADGGDWEKYLELQGGVVASRADMPLRVYTVGRVDTDTGEVISNRYGEIVGKVEGIAMMETDRLKTRLHIWRIQPKAGQPAKTTPAWAEDVQTVEGFDLMRPSPSSSSGVAPLTPWSTVNNCTGSGQGWGEGKVWGSQS